MDVGAWLGSTNNQKAGAAKPIFGDYKNSQAGGAVIKDHQLGFHKKVTKTAWQKVYGKQAVKTRAGEEVSADELHKIVGEEVGKSQAKGLSGKQLKTRLVKKGFKYKDADKIARAATYHYYEPPQDGPTKEEVSRRVAQAKASADHIDNSSAQHSMADNIQASKGVDALKRSKVAADGYKVGSKQLGVEAKKSKNTMLGANQEKVMSVEERGGQISAGEIEDAQASIGGGKDAQDVAGGSQMKEDKDNVIDFKKAKAKRGGGAVHLATSGAGGTRRMSSGSGDDAQFIQKSSGEIESGKARKDRINKEMADARGYLGGLKRHHSDEKEMLMKNLELLHPKIVDDEDSAESSDEPQAADDYDEDLKKAA